ncbi:class I SAM-dependent RNA methyltransferase [Phanerochaete sordida]|uniref:Class I SAM-dependent RNA methyltransferase n=1 Tax=Phanerochaete sordida TaxID=48140 RepID=A0A9P3LHE1_9APHY|nr:class I SAM-dependent RNA methyltransferase [Phanerochaete sordida]
MNFYFEAAGVLDKLDAKQGSIKGLIATVPEKNRKRTAALVIETLKYKPVLTDVLDAASLLKQEKKITSRNLALVLVHDLLLANGIQAGDGPVKQAMLRHKTRLNSELQRIKIKRGAKSTQELARTADVRAEKIPRYVRVNSTCWSTEEAVKTFISRGYRLSNPFEEKGFAKDEHIRDLLLFPPDTQFSDDPLYHEGKIILQDKASCFPAYVLAPPAHDRAVVIDATAAPGNKTSHLCALMGNKGKLFAFERDRKRFGTLKTMLARARCTNVEPVNADFMTTSPADARFAAVTHILLDPSCSGSGIVNRLDYLVESEADDGNEERLQKLASFQLLMIRHAMKFPAVQRIAYSTCSVHATENEHVVREALRTDECAAGKFRLAPRDMVLPAWPRRGLPAETDAPDDAESLVRCSPGEDATNGFFVSLFVRESLVPEAADRNNVTKRKAENEATQKGDNPSQRKRKKRKKNAAA